MPNADSVGQAEIIICEGCHYSFEVDESRSVYCKRCRKMRAHLQEIGDKELRRKMFAEWAKFVTISTLLIGIGIGVLLARYLWTQ